MSDLPFFVVRYFCDKRSTTRKGYTKGAANASGHAAAGQAHLAPKKHQFQEREVEGSTKHFSASADLLGGGGILEAGKRGFSKHG